MAAQDDKGRRAPRKRSVKAAAAASQSRSAAAQRADRPNRAARSQSSGTQNAPSQASSRSASRDGSQRRPSASRQAAASSARRGGARASEKTSNLAGARGYSLPGVWTKNPKSAAAPSFTWASDEDARGKARASSARRASSQAQKRMGSGLGGILQGVGSVLAAALGAFLRFVTGSVARMAVCAIVVVCIVALGADAVLTGGRAYAGVRVGDVDVAGMTRDEAVAAVNEEYAVRVEGATAVIYSSEDVRSQVEQGDLTATATLEESSVEQARDNGQAWTPTAASLEASVPTDALVDEALRVGREDGGLFERLRSTVFGRTIEPRVEFNHSSIESLAESIDTSIGEARVDWGVSVEAGVASTTAGNDGSMVNRTWLEEQLAAAYLSADESARSFVAETQHAPMRIDEAAAQAVCDEVNAAIADGATFTYRGATWEADAATVGAWVATETLLLDESGQVSAEQPRYEDASGTWALVASIDRDEASPVILENVKDVADEDPLSVSFSNEDGEIFVETNSSGEVPLVGDAAETLDAALFGEYPVTEGSPVEIEIESAVAPDRMTFDEAVDLGVITAFSSFTTEYTTGAGTEERNHNIHLAADLLDGSIAKAGGGVWSFNETAGNCNEEKGFQAAGAIVAGEYTDSIGGGICQVATTVYNAVYESGLAIVLRFNHSLYISSYPVGRDAAVSWPDLDLQWRNDEESDVVLRMSYTDGTVTATLYGVDPEYTVSTEVGQWEEGEKHSTRYVEDASLGQGASYVQTAGSDGSRITVVRTVTDSTGALLREESFTSVYDPKTEVVVVGPGYTPPQE